MKYKNKKSRESIFFRVLNSVLKLENLKLFEFSISFLKGFNIKLEFYEKKKG